MGTVGKKNALLFILVLILLLSVFPVLAVNTIKTNSVYMPNDTTVGSCTELCDGTPDCDCEEQCACTPGDDCINKDVDDKVIITFFYSSTCPHCHAALDFFADLANTRDDFVLDKYEVVHNEVDRDYAIKFCEEQDVPFKSVPTFFIGDKYFVGYGEDMNDDILKAIDIVKNTTVNNTSGEIINDTTIKIPFFGEVDATAVSIPLLAIILGFIDGFNPCAFFVLLFLLSMLVYAKSRKRMALIGGIFVFFSALIYFIFMSAWLNFFLVTSSIKIITTVAGAVALVIAVINIKDFFAFKKGVSLSISDKNRKSLIVRMRGLLKAESLISMIIGTIVLAISTNLYELLCTAGFPMVFTKTLTLQSLSLTSYYSYILLYCLFYIIPLLVIVIIFTATLGSKKLSQKQGETLKLMSGMMMLALGGMLVFNPGMLSNIAASLALIFGALLITFIIVFVRKKLEAKKLYQKEKVGLRKTKSKEKEIKKGK